MSSKEGTYQGEGAFLLLIFTNGGGLVADEINEKKLVAEVVLDANQALSDKKKLSYIAYCTSETY